MVDVISIFTKGRQAAMCYVREDADGIISPLHYWESRPDDRDILVAFSRMSAEFERGDYVVANGLFKNEKDRYENPIEQALSDLCGAFFLALPPRQEIALESALRATEAKGLLDVSRFEIWPKIRAELDRSNDLSRLAMAFLQGVSELRNPEAVKYPFRNLSIRVATEEEDLSFALG